MTNCQPITGGIFYCRVSANFSVSASNKLLCNLTGQCFEIGNKNIPPTVSSNFITTASFNDIRKKIQKNIDQSKDSILVSVAWLTSKDLLGQLIDKLESGCKVEILISDHFENQRLTYDKFIEKGGQVFIVPTKSGKFLHDKFAIFDNTRLIAGSYNWTNSAEFYNPSSR
jgi:phosphatidylserine/phosphatidylglycerophosphate/cardiolipin synthase-like enzyme